MNFPNYKTNRGARRLAEAAAKWILKHLGLDVFELQRFYSLARREPLGAARRLRGRKSLERWIQYHFDRGECFVELLTRLTDASVLEVREVLNERALSDLHVETRDRARAFEIAPRILDYYGSYRSFYYALLRLTRPLNLVETGTWWGVSSTYILAALDQNKRGKLFSIDLQSEHRASQDSVAQVGALVPERLRERWQLRSGLSELLLPQLLETVIPLDIFIHDSDHSLGNMLFELRLAYSHLRPGGLLVADDIEWNDAFDIFDRESCHSNDRIVVVNRGYADMGIIVKADAPS